MSELDEKLNAILSNPQMMQQIMSLAQAMNQGSVKQEDPMPNRNNPPAENSPLGINPSMLTRLSSIMQHGTIDADQQSLLKALSPYLSRPKLQKLERAMHAAKMAGLASELTGQRNHSSYLGR